jgi:CO dehydrogenase/acetyl-CoA synthase beta subunit
MSDVIEFLEKLGSDARLFQAAKETVALALADAQVEAAAGEAILARNVEELQALLKVVPLHCFQSAPKREGEEEEEEEEKEEEGEKQPKKPSKSTSQSVLAARADKLA